MKPDNVIPPFSGLGIQRVDAGVGAIRPTPNTVWKRGIGIKSQTPKEKRLEKEQKNMKQLLFTGEQKLFQLSENKKDPLANGVIHLSEGRLSAMAFTLLCFQCYLPGHPAHP